MREAPDDGLAGLSYLVIGDGSGGSGVVEEVTDLSGATFGADDHFLVGEGTGSIASPDLTTNLNFENEDNVTHLLVRGFTGSNNQDLDTDDDGTLDVTPWTEVVDSVALVAGDAGERVYSETRVRQDGGPDHAFRRPDATGPWQVGGDAVGTDDTPGRANGGGGEEPVAETREIAEIQGAGHRSPLAGQTVATTGVVTAVDSNGFYLQDAEGDGDVATSDAVFVFTDDEPTVSVGDSLRVTGRVSEFQPGGASSANLTTTQVSATEIATLSTGNALPEAVVLGEDRRPPTEVIDDDGLGSYDPATDGIDFYESLEGMRVTVDDALAVSPTNGFGETWAVADGGEGATNLNERGAIVVGPGDLNPERIQIQVDGGILPGFEPSVDAGAELGDVTGVVGYGFGNFEVNVTEPFTPKASDLRPETTELEGGRERLTIGSYNVLNLDPVVEDRNLVGGSRDVDDDVGSGQYARIARQIVGNLGAPDVVALQEVQDSSGAENEDRTGAPDVVDAARTAQVLIDAIVEAGGPRYTYVDVPPEDDTQGGQPGGNIRVGYLYNDERVDLVEGSLERVEAPADGPLADAFADSRIPLAAQWEFNGQVATTVNVHFTSKGGSTPLFGETQPPVNGGEEQRLEQAKVVEAYVQGLLAEDPDADAVVLGDFNEFYFEEPLEELDDGPLANLVEEKLAPEERYSYVFEGNAQALDNAFVTEGSLDRTTFDVVHANAQFADQVSDHDPLLVALDLRDDDRVEIDLESIRGPRGSTDQGVSTVELTLTNTGTDPLEVWSLDVDLDAPGARFQAGRSKDAKLDFNRETGVFETRDSGASEAIEPGESIDLELLVRGGRVGADDLSFGFRTGTGDFLMT